MGDVAALTWPLSRPGVLPCVRARSVRRCLFGRSDPDEIKAYCENLLQKEAEKDKQRWNFDFVNERPLAPGRYLWERVSKKDEDTKKDEAVTEKSDPEEKSSSKQEEQTQITDFMRKRKSSNFSSKDFIRKKRRSKIRRNST